MVRDGRDASPEAEAVATGLVLTPLTCRDDEAHVARSATQIPVHEELSSRTRAPVDE